MDLVTRTPNTLATEEDDIEGEALFSGELLSGSLGTGPSS